MSFRHAEPNHTQAHPQGVQSTEPTIVEEVKLQSIDVAGDPQCSVYSSIRGAAEKLHSDPVDCESHATKLSPV